MTFSGMDISRKQERERGRYRGCGDDCIGQEKWLGMSAASYNNATSLIVWVTQRGRDRWQNGWTGSCKGESNGDWWPNKPMSLLQAAGGHAKMWIHDTWWWECCMIRGFLLLCGHCKSFVTKTSIHPDVPATALLYIVNAVYTKMYFLWKLWMCTVEQVVYVRQQTVQHTPVKLKTGI